MSYLQEMSNLLRMLSRIFLSYCSLLNLILQFPFNVVFLYLPFLLFITVFSEAPPPPPPPVVYFRYTDDTLRGLIKRLRERTEILKEKAIDPYATSPEITPPVSKYSQRIQKCPNKSVNTKTGH